MFQELRHRPCTLLFPIPNFWRGDQDVLLFGQEQSLGPASGVLLPRVCITSFWYSPIHVGVFVFYLYSVLDDLRSLSNFSFSSSYIAFKRYFIMSISNLVIPSLAFSDQLFNLSIEFLILITTIFTSKSGSFSNLSGHFVKYFIL